jgi:hypothetical protein
MQYWYEIVTLEFVDIDFQEIFDFVKKEIEAVQGWAFEEEQIQATKLALDNQVSVITGPAGCVDCDSEFFNGREWKKISEWTPEDKVLQYNDDGTTNLVTPERYIKEPQDTLWHF